MDDDVEALHRSRVASRRVREVLPVLHGSEAAGGAPAALRKRVRQLTRALGGVRELDVALLILDELAARHPELGAVVAAVRCRVADDRRARRQTMAEQLDDSAGHRLPEDLEALSSTVQVDPSAILVGRLENRVARLTDRLEGAIAEAGSLFVSERLHAVRIAAKQLRYALELVHEFGGVGTRRLTNTLKQYQDLLGRLHDLEVVSGYVRREAWGATNGHAENARRLQEVIDLEIRVLHATYLAGVGALGRLLAACRSTVLTRLAAGRKPRRQPGGSQ